MWSPSQTGGFPPGTPVSSHMKTIPKANIDANEHDEYKLYNLFRNRCKTFKENKKLLELLIHMISSYLLKIACIENHVLNLYLLICL